MPAPLLFCSLALALALPTIPSAPAGDPAPDPTPHLLERQLGWRALFDGRTTRGWVGHGRPRFPVQGWEVADGCLHKVAGASGGDVVATELFEDFELEFEWRVAPGANGGLKYRVPPREEPGGMLGPEYQVLDDAAHAGEPPVHRAGALYALYPAEGAAPAPAGEFNRARIVARGASLEHWLNGARVVACEVGSPDWEARRAASKFAGVEGFAAPAPGRIGVQDHGGEVWYRGLRVRPLPPPGEELRLLADGTLAGWREVGDAVWTPLEGGVRGEVGGGGQSFLVSEREYGDFVLELELRCEDRGNSGVQIRSHQNAKGRVQGYQVEIDPSDRAWSAGVYDEARRGWLDDLSDNEPARAAFDRDGWNRYRIECAGPWIRTWVNGVPAADLLDPLDLSGFLALQVHSGKNTKVVWRALVLRDLGTRAWEPLVALDGGEPWRTNGGQPELDKAGVSFRCLGPDSPIAVALPAELDDFALRFDLEAPEATLRVGFRSAGLDLPLPDPGDPAAGPLAATAEAWVLDLGALAERPAKGRLAVCAFGGRAAAHLDGKRLADLTAPAAARAGLVVVEARGPAGARVRLSGIERMGAPRR